MSRFCTAHEAGQPCRRRALPGQSLCSSHHPNPYAPSPCAWLNRFGDRCHSFALRGQDHCFSHSPRNPRLRHPPVPAARKERQMARLASFIFSSLPECPKSPHELLRDQ